MIIIHHFGKPDPSNPVGLKYRMRGARSIQDWADTVMAISTPPGYSDNSSRPRRHFTFVKVRNGPIHKPILVERSPQFVHCEISENEDEMMAIQECVREYGHNTGSQRRMVERLQQALNLSYRPALERLKAAIEGGYVIEQVTMPSGTKSYVVEE